MINHLIPYPAIIDQLNGGAVVHVFGFDELRVIGDCAESTIKSAQNELMRRILGLIRKSKQVPPPDQHLEAAEERELIVIYPMANAYI